MTSLDNRPANFWEQAADVYQQIAAEGGDPRTDPRLSGDERVLNTIRHIAETRTTEKKA